MLEKRLPFFKVSGAGNDFIALVEPEQSPSGPNIAALCRRRVSLGADGLFVLKRAEPAADNEVRVRMCHYNADGGRAELCGNGTRCAAALAYALRWLGQLDTLHLLTDAGELLAQRTSSNRFRVQAPFPDEEPRKLSLSEAFAAFDGPRPPLTAIWRLTVGVPHVVATVDPTVNLETLDLSTCGPWLRHHELAGPNGANVNFVQEIARRGSSGSPSAIKHNDSTHAALFRIRTWERGVEGETLACGSGAVASSVVLAGAGTPYPIELLVRSDALLRVWREQMSPETENEGPSSRLWQEGPAHIVARGELLPTVEPL